MKLRKMRKSITGHQSQPEQEAIDLIIKPFTES